MKTFHSRHARALALAFAFAAGSFGVANATGTPHNLAVMSFVGDSIQVVTYEGRPGRLTDANERTSVPFEQAKLDLVALKAAGEAAQSAEPRASVALLSASEPALFVDQGAWFDGDHVHLPEAIAAAVAREHADQLLLVTKYRGAAHIRLKSSITGSGNLEGMGFYVDTQLPIRDADSDRLGRGYIAPYAYIEATLIDVASGTVLRQSRIAEGYSLAAARSKDDSDAWSVLTPRQKIDTLRRLLDRQLRKAVPELFAQRAHSSGAE